MSGYGKEKLRDILYLALYREMILAKVEQAHRIWRNKDAAKEDNDTCPRETQWHLTKVANCRGWLDASVGYRRTLFGFGLRVFSYKKLINGLYDVVRLKMQTI